MIGPLFSTVLQLAAGLLTGTLLSVASARQAHDPAELKALYEAVGPPPVLEKWELTRDEIFLIQKRAIKLRSLLSWDLFTNESLSSKDLPPGFMEEVERLRLRLLDYSKVREFSDNRGDLHEFSAWADAYESLVSLRFTLLPDDRRKWEEHLATVLGVYGGEPPDPGQNADAAIARIQAVLKLHFTLAWPRVAEDPGRVVSLLMAVREKWIPGDMPRAGKKLLTDSQWTRFFEDISTHTLPPGHAEAGTEKWAGAAKWLPASEAFWKDFLTDPDVSLERRSYAVLSYARSLYTFGRAKEAEKLISWFHTLPEKRTRGRYDLMLLILHCQIAMNGLGDQELARRLLTQIEANYQSLNPPANSTESQLYTNVTSLYYEVMKRPADALAYQVAKNNRERFRQFVLGRPSEHTNEETAR